MQATKLTAGQLAEQYTAQDIERIVAEARQAAYAAADTLRKYGFTAYAGSRLD